MLIPFLYKTKKAPLRIFLAITFIISALNASGQKYWIVGGGYAKEGELPWVADIRDRGSHFCGGALVAPQWVLTAAHCVDDGSVIGKRVRLNTVSTSGPINPGGGVEASVIEIFAHPMFDIDDMSNGYDIALLKLRDPVTTIAPIKIVAEADTNKAYITNAPVKVAGWGLTDPRNFTPPDIMKWATSKVYNFAMCSGGSLSPKMFCIGYTGGEDPSGAGAGDSGGPAWREVSGVNEIIGVVSGGDLLATAVDTPGFFTKVAYFRLWIDSVMSIGTSIKDAHLSENLVSVGIDYNNILLKIGYTSTQHLTADLYDMNGVRISSNTIPQPNNSTLTINASSLAAGMYAIKMTDAEGRFLVKKIFKY